MLNKILISLSFFIIITCNAFAGTGYYVRYFNNSSNTIWVSYKPGSCFETWEIPANQTAIKSGSSFTLDRVVDKDKGNCHDSRKQAIWAITTDPSSQDIMQVTFDHKKNSGVWQTQILASSLQDIYVNNATCQVDDSYVSCLNNYVSGVGEGDEIRVYISDSPNF